ncbi:hypothetical protein HN362_05170 [bacterium]|nr:hypothetical protein [bacterium]
MKKYLQNLLIEIFNSNLGIVSFYRLGKYLFGLPVLSKQPRLKPIYARCLLQSYLNAQVIPYNLQTIWPSWVYKQLFAQSKHFLPQNFWQGLTNQAQRNWTVLSFPGQEESAIVDPSGMVTPAQHGWSLECWLKINGKIIAPGYIENPSQSLNPTLPVVTTSFTAEGVSVNASIYFNTYPHQNILFQRIKIKNETASNLDFSFYFAIRPYNPEGLAPIKDIVYLTNQSFVVDHKLALILDQKPDNVLCLKGGENTGPLGPNLDQWEMILKAQCQSNFATAIAEYRVSLNAYEEKSFSCKLPLSSEPLLGLGTGSINFYHKQKLNKQINFIKNYNFYSEQDKLVADWEKVTAEVSKIVIPDKKIENLFKQNVYHLLNFIGQKYIYSAGFTYQHHCFRDLQQMAFALNRIGGASLVEKIINNLIHPQWLFFQSPFNQGELDNFGQGINLIYDNYNFHKKISMLNHFFPFIDYCVKQIEKNTVHKSHTAFNGLLKKSFSFTKTGLKDHYLWDNFWALAGLRQACQIARILNLEKKLAKYTLLEKKLTNSLKTFLSNALEKKEQAAFIPISAHRLYDSALISSLVSVYPLRLLGINDELVQNTLALIEKQHISHNLLFSNVENNGINIIQNARLAQIYLEKQDPKALTIFNWLTEKASGTGAWPENVHPTTGVGIGGAGHSGLASVEYLMLVRNMLIKDHDPEQLTLTPMLPENWLPDSKGALSALRIPTTAGMVSYTFSRNGHRITLELETQYQLAPKKLKINFPVMIKNIHLLDKVEPVNSHSVTIPVNIKKVELEI